MVNVHASQKPMIENNDWHQVYFDWDDVRDGCLDTMQHQFELLWSDAGRPVEAALFLNRLVTGGRHIYFSPVASRIAPALLERYVALKCDEPSDLGPTLFVGNPAAEKRLLTRKQ
jgi:hypothetical protein